MLKLRVPSISEKEGTSLTVGNDLATNSKEQEEESISAILTSSELSLLKTLRCAERCTVSEQETRGRSAKRLPIITKMADQGLLDDTYAGVTQTLLSGCGRWSFNTFSLDVCTGGRPLSNLLVHLFHQYGFIQHFQLDIIKVWRCFNLMEAAYHRHNPYHNSVHAADVTQAMHCFLQESKFSVHLTPLEAMSSVIAAVAHDLDHPGVTQAFLVATSNHLVTLYHNSSVLENHHWRTAISCLSESGIFNHLDREVWNDIQSQIRSLILATDITRQKEFLAKFKNYLSTESLDMEQTQYRHFALQIALKCADLCNPCRPWPISQRWSYQVCQEFYRQGAYERQLKLPLTPTFDCSTTKVAKIQTDFFQCVVSPLFETWDHFLQTPLSNKLLVNLQHNFSQWQQRITAQPTVDLPQIQVQVDEQQKNPQQNLLVADMVLKQHRSKSDSGMIPGLLAPKTAHMETYSTEELRPSTTLLSLSSITNTVQLRQVYATTKVDHNLICPTVFQPLSTNGKKIICDEKDICSNDDNAQYCHEISGLPFLEKPRAMSLVHTSEDYSVVHRRASDIAFHVSPPPDNLSETNGTPRSTKLRSHSLVGETKEIRQCLEINRRASDFAFHLVPPSEDSASEESYSTAPESDSTRFKPRSRSLVQGSDEQKQCLQMTRRASDFGCQSENKPPKECTDGSHCGTPVRNIQIDKSETCTDGTHCGTPPELCFTFEKPRSQSLVHEELKRCFQVNRRASDFAFSVQSDTPVSQKQCTDGSHCSIPFETCSSKLQTRSISLVPNSEEQNQCLSVHRIASDVTFNIQNDELVNSKRCTDDSHCEIPLGNCTRPKPRSQSLVHGSEALNHCSKILLLQNRRASDFDFYFQKSRLLSSTNESSSNTITSSNQCSKLSCICRTDSDREIPSWCLHISRSFSAERPVRPTRDFDSPLPPGHEFTCYNSRRRGSAPVTYSPEVNRGLENRNPGLRGGSERFSSAERRWSIPMELTGLQVHPPTTKPSEQPPTVLNVPRRSSFGLLEPIVVGLGRYHKLQETSKDDFLPSFISSGRRRGSLPTDLLKSQDLVPSRPWDRRDLLSVLIGSRRLEMLSCLWRGQKPWDEEEDECLSYQPRRGSVPLNLPLSSENTLSCEKAS